MVPLDEQCPHRGAGLTHHAKEGTWVCEFCNQVTYTPSRMPAERQIPAPGDADFDSLTGQQWHRLVIERQRYEAGDLSDDWPVHKRHRRRNGRDV